LIQVAEEELEGYEQFVLSLLSGSEAWHTEAVFTENMMKIPWFLQAKYLQMPRFHIAKLPEGTPDFFFQGGPLKVLCPSGKSIPRAHVWGSTLNLSDGVFVY